MAEKFDFDQTLDQLRSGCGGFLFDLDSKWSTHQGRPLSTGAAVGGLQWQFPLEGQNQYQRSDCNVKRLERAPRARRTI